MINLLDDSSLISSNFYNFDSVRFRPGRWDDDPVTAFLLKFRTLSAEISNYGVNHEPT